MLLALLALASAQDPVLDSLKLSPTVHVLDNGLTVIVHEDHRAAVVATSLLYRVGASEDRGPDQDGRTGKAHLFEHLMFEGSANVPQAGSEAGFDALLAEAGATNNAWTSHDWTVYQIQGPPGALDLALFVESDRMGWLLEGLSDEDLANQQGVVSNERLGDEASDSIYPMYALNWLLYAEGHPYRWPVLGTMDDIQGVQREELEAFFHTWYGPDNAVLVIVGDVDTQQALASARRWFDEVPRLALPAPERPVWPAGAQHELLGSERWTMLNDQDDPALIMAWPTVPRGHPDEPALDVLSLILSGGRGTRLDDALFYERDLASSVSTWTSNGRLGGEFVISLSRDDRDLAPLVRKVDRQLRRVQRRGVEPSEVDRVVSWWAGATIRELEDVENMADILNDCQQVWGQPSCLDQELARYLAVTAEDVQRVANTWLGEDRVLLSVVPTGEDARFALPRSAEVYPP